MTDRYLDDLTVGESWDSEPFTITEDEIIAFATEFDPQPMHVDKAAAEAGRFGGLIASGWQTCGIAMRLMADAALAGSESFASPGIDYIKWPHPVRAGDALRARAEVVEVRRARTKPMGILRWRWQLFNQDDVEVLDLQATSLFALKD